MSDTVTLQEAITKLESEIENSSPSSFEEDWGFPIGCIEDDWVFSQEAIGQLGEVCAQLGIPYNGKTLETYVSKGEVRLSRPRLISNGISAGVQWGPDFTPLEDDGEVWSFRTLSIPSFCFMVPKIKFLLPIILEYNRSVEGDRAKAEAAFADCSTWGELKELLVKNLPVLKGDALWAVPFFRVLEAEKKASDDDRDYWVLTVQIDKEGSQSKMFMSGSTDVQVGDAFKVDPKAKSITNQRTKLEVELGGYIKLHDLGMGTHLVTKIAPKTGEYGGYNLSIRGAGIAGSNAKIERWIAAHGCEVVTPENPAKLSITSISEKAGKYTVACTIALEKDEQGSVREQIKARMLKAKKGAVAPAATPEEDEEEPNPSTPAPVAEKKSKPAESQTEIPWKDEGEDNEEFSPPTPAPVAEKKRGRKPAATPTVLAEPDDEPTEDEWL